MADLNVDEKLKSSVLPKEMLDELDKNHKTKCEFIIYNLLNIHHDSIKNPRTYLYDFFETSRCDEFFKESSFFAKIKRKLSSDPDKFKGYNQLRHNRAKYIKQLGEDTVRNVLEKKFTQEDDNEEKKVAYVINHYYEWNRKCLADSLFTLNPRKYVCYLFERQQNSAVITGMFAIFGIGLGYAAHKWKMSNLWQNLKALLPFKKKN